jgi:hypothetical protein
VDDFIGFFLLVLAGVVFVPAFIFLVVKAGTLGFLRAKEIARRMDEKKKKEENDGEA